MKNWQKTLVVLLILFLPVVFVLFLFTGESVHTKLEVYYDMRNPDFDPGFVQSNGCEPNFVDSTHRVTDFSLTNQLGKNIELSDLKGDIFVANFILTRCTQNICPIMSSELGRVQEAFKDEPHVKIVSYSIDPTYDTAEVLKAYADLYNADHSRWYFLTGSEEAIYQQAKCSYFLPAQKNDSYVNIDHSERLVLVDGKGQIRGFYKGTDKKEVDRLIHEIQILNLERERS